MEIRKCQIDADHPCLNRGVLCLKTPEEKREFNRQIRKMQIKLERVKFKNTEKINGKE